jgi:SAM-dependent methyltransferase
VSPLATHPIGTEFMDGHAGDPAVVRTTLSDIARSNRWFGGRSAVARGVDALARGTSGSLSVLDVGAGGGDIVTFVARRMAMRGIALRPFALERHPEAARMCRECGLPAVLADGGALPVADRSVDIVVASQLLHHMDRQSAVRLIREMDRVARVGVVIADLRRAFAAEAGIWVASWLLGFHPVSRHDGVLSVRRGFTVTELTGLLDEAGVPARVERRARFRLLAMWRRDRARR